MTLNGVTALILRYFTEFDSFAGRYYVTALKMELIVCKIIFIVSQLHLAQTDLRSSRTVSLRQLSFLFSIVVPIEWAQY